MTTHTLADILRDSDYALDIFSQEEIAALMILDRKDKPYFKDFVDGTERPAKPEEVVRQLFLYRLLHTYHYPSGRIIVEKPVQFG